MGVSADMRESFEFVASGLYMFACCATGIALFVQLISWLAIVLAMPYTAQPPAKAAALLVGTVCISAWAYLLYRISHPTSDEEA